jgi:hypothetical protein
VTIRADTGFNPVLAFNPKHRAASADGETTLFVITDGELTLERLTFHLAPLEDPARLQSLLSVTGAGRCKLKDCLATLAGENGPRMALVFVGDPAGMMMGMGGRPPRGGIPAIEIADCLVRGHGDMVAVRASRPYNLEVKNSVVALAGSLLSVEGNRPEANANGESATVVLSEVTAHVTQHLIVLRSDMATPLHVPLMVSASSCVFAAAEGNPLLRIEGPRVDTELLRWLTWLGKGNAYSTTGPLLICLPPRAGSMPYLYGSDSWLKLWGRDDDQPLFLQAIKFAGFPGMGKGWGDAVPDDFAILGTAPTESNVGTRGPDLDRLTRSLPRILGDQE